MASPHKSKFKPRHDLKARLSARGIKFASFAREGKFSAKTVYAVLDGYRAKGPEAQRIIKAIRAV